ncbi:MAG: metal ABC transporter permease [Clostridia bacterium]|nr:metal ABC transporter permease [Clostridia bacterium]
MEILEFAFMRRAFLVGLLLAVIVPCIGVVTVFRRMSMVGDALSHSSLAGVAVGLLAGFNPVIGAIGASLAGATAIEVIRKRIPRYAEMAIAIVMSAGIGLAGVLSGFVQNAAGFSSFLFGSIVAISDLELGVVVTVAVVVLVSFLLLYKELFYLAYDEQAARIAGVPVRLVGPLFTLLTAVTVSVAARTVGALVVSSLMVVPTACAMTVARSYRQTVVFSAGFGVLFVLIGLTFSYYARLRPGGTIVLVGIACLLVLQAAVRLAAALGRRSRGAAAAAEDERGRIMP